MDEIKLLDKQLNNTTMIVVQSRNNYIIYLCQFNLITAICVKLLSSQLYHGHSITHIMFHYCDEIDYELNEYVTIKTGGKFLTFSLSKLKITNVKIASYHSGSCLKNIHFLE